MSIIKKNSRGQIITGPKKLRNPSYGTGNVDSHGNPIVDWERCRTEFADERGFDTRNREINGEYYLTVKLRKGTLLIRYGNENGKFTAPKGTAYDSLSLPYTEESVEYHEYKVIADCITVFCVVDQGKVAPMFGCKGQGIQYFHMDGTIRNLIRDCKLERIVS